MPRRRKPPTEAGAQPEVTVPKELLDQLVKGPMTQGDLESMFRQLKKVVIERAMSAEMNEHLGYRSGEDKPDGQSNQRNGTSSKTVITDEGPLRIEVPRDREGSFEPQIRIGPKKQTEPTPPTPKHWIATSPTHNWIVEPESSPSSC